MIGGDLKTFIPPLSGITKVGVPPKTPAPPVLKGSQVLQTSTTSHVFSRGHICALKSLYISPGHPSGPCEPSLSSGFGILSMQTVSPLLQVPPALLAPTQSLPQNPNLTCCPGLRGRSGLVGLQAARPALPALPPARDPAARPPLAGWLPGTK